MRMYITLIYVLFCVVNTSPVYSQSCDRLGGVYVKYRELELLKNFRSPSQQELEAWPAIEATTCLSDATFEPKNIGAIAVICVGSNLLKLDENFVTNMTSLKRLFIAQCPIEEIKPGAFLNLPNLESIDLFDIPLKNISKSVFNIFPKLESIWFVNNNITSIEDQAFSNMPNLKEFVIRSNRLEYLRREWFTNTSNIEYFEVSKNLIGKILSEMFHGWKKLKTLDLSSNAISVIEGPMFSRSNALVMTTVSLHRNRLTSLPADIFPDYIFIKNLMISGNLLNYIPEELLRRIRVSHIATFGNPFNCHCSNKMKKILLERDVQIDDKSYVLVAECIDQKVPVCGFSANNNSSSTCDELVDKELTKRLISYMKKVGYDKVLSGKTDQQCAMFEYDN